MTTISDRILEAMNDAGFTSQTALSRASGVPQPTINRIINKVAGTPETQTIQKIADACDVASQWLMDGTGPKSRQERNALAHGQTGDFQRVIVSDGSSEQVAQIKSLSPPLSKDVKGSEGEQGGYDKDGVFLSRGWFEKRGFRKENLVAIQVLGQSMEPTVFDGDIVIVNKADKTLVDGAAYALWYEDELLIKRLARDAGDWWLTSDNPDQRRYPRKVYRESESHIIGRLVQRLSEQI